MAAFYANENFPVPVVVALRLLGHDVLTTHDAGRSGQAIADPDVLQFALESQRAVLTQNRRDFIRLHSIHPDHFGIVVCTIDPDLPALAQRIHETVSSANSLIGKLIRVIRPPQ